MKLKKVILHNWGSWKHLVFKLDNQGLVLIEGPTGAGKSTIFRAIYWCLMGMTPEGHLVDELIRDGEKSAAVQVTLQGKEIIDVTRYRNDPNWGNRVRLRVGGRELLDRDTKVSEANKLTLQECGIESDLFFRCLYFIQRSTDTFPALTDHQQKLVLEQITRTDVFVKAEDITKNKLADVQHRLERIIAKRESLDVVLAHAQKDRDVSDGDVSKRIVVLKGEIDRLTKRLSNWSATEEGYEVLQKRYQETIQAISVLREKREQISVQSARAKKALKKGRCFFCRSKADPKRITKLLREDRLRRQAYLDNIVTLQSRGVNEATDIANFAKRIAEFNALRAQRIQYIRDMGELQKPPRKQMWLKKTQRQLQLLNEKDEVLSRRLRALDFWKQGFGPRGLRAQVLESALKALMQYANMYLRAVGMKRLQVQYTLDKQRIVQQFSGRSYASLSGGEKQLVNLCVELGKRDLAEASSRFMFDAVILDEPFEGLDDELQKKMHVILKRIPKASIFLITHKAKQKMTFDKVYRVEMKDGVSTLVEGLDEKGS